MKTVFVIFSSPEFMNRTNVAINSITKFHPEVKIDLTTTESAQPRSNYVPGTAEKRITRSLELLTEGYDRVVVWGADCVLYDRIDNFLGLITQGTVVLTPHVIQPPLVRGAEMYTTGHANGDLIGFGWGCQRILEWLSKQNMICSTASGHFYEQTWLSALPFIYEQTKICRDPDINVAWFNLHERPFVTTPKMIQYSGFVQGNPKALSKHMRGGAPFINTSLLDKFHQYDKDISV